MTKPTGWWRVRRWVKRILMGIVPFLIVALILGMIYEAFGRRSARADYPPSGQLVDVGERKMHIDCRGTGSPTVIFESGLGTGGSLDWSLVHDDTAGFTRVCAYDRAGIMWSESKNTPQDAAAVAEDLHELLKEAGISGPLVLVGHSIGGPYTRTYVGKYGEQVAGLVMVDPSHPDQVARLGAITGIDVHPRQASTLMHAAKALAWTGIVRFVASRSEVPKLRSAADTKKLREAMATKFAYFSTSVDGGTAELDGYDRTQAEARAVRSFGDRPLIVLTAMAPFTPQQLKASGLTPDQGARFKEEWRKLHAEQAAFSTRGRQQVVPDATHFIQVDRPDVVVAAVREVVDAVRAGPRSSAK